MKKLLTFCCILLIFQINSGQVYSQSGGSKEYKNYVTFNLTRLLLLEARFGYERRLAQHHVIRTNVGLQFPVSSYSFTNISGYVPYYYAVSNGFYFGLGYNYLIIPQSYFYVSAEIYTSFYGYDNKYYRNCQSSNSNSEISLQSMWLQKSGVKFLIGKKLTLHPNKQTRLEIEFSGGIGLQYRDEETIVYEIGYGSCDPYYKHKTIYNPPRETISKQWIPSLHAGILLSLGF